MQFIIPKGTILTIPLNVLHVNTEMWGVDAHLFRPERWMDRSRSRKGRELFAFSEGYAPIVLSHPWILTDICQSTILYWQSFRAV